MTSIRQHLLRALSTIAILLTYVILLGLLIFFITNPEIFKVAKNVIAFFFQLLFLGSVTHYLGRRIKRGIEVYGSLSNALTKLLINERLIHIMIWIFIVVQMSVFSYILPVPSLYVEIKNKENSELVDSDLIDSVKIITKDDSPLSLKQKEDAKGIYFMKFLSRRDPKQLRVIAEGYQKYQEPFVWGSFAPIDLFFGHEQEILLVPEEPLKITVKAMPASAKIDVKKLSGDELFEGVGIFEAQRDERVEIIVSHEDYVEQRETFLPQKNDTLSFNLTRKFCRVRLRAYDEGGREKKEMTIYIDKGDGFKKMTGKKSGDVILLKPGVYNVYLERISGDSKVYIDTTEITVKSCRDTLKTFEAKRKRL